MRSFALSIVIAPLFAASAFAETGPIDANGDGVLTPAEFAPVERMGGARFDVFDKDGDGVVSKLEFNSGIQDVVDGRDGNREDNDAMNRRDQLTRAFSNATSY